MNPSIEVHLPKTGYVRLSEILQIYPVSKSTWWAGIKVGRFPQGIKLAPRITAWKVEDIRTLLENPKAFSGEK